MKVQSSIFLTHTKIMDDIKRPDRKPLGHFLGAQVTSIKTNSGFYNRTSPLVNFTGLQDFATFLTRTASDSDKDYAVKTLLERTGVSMSLNEATNAASLLKQIDQKTFNALAALDNADTHDQRRTLLSASEFEHLLALDGNQNTLSEQDIALFKSKMK